MLKRSWVVLTVLFALVACQKPLHMRHMSPPDFERWCRVRSTIEAIALAVGIDPNA